MCTLNIYHHSCSHSQDALDIDLCSKAEENNLPRCSDLTERDIDIPSACPDCHGTSEEQHDANLAAALATSKEDYRQQTLKYGTFDNSDDEKEMIQKLRNVSLQDGILADQEMMRLAMQESLRDWERTPKAMDNWSQRAKGHDEDEEAYPDSYQVPAVFRPDPFAANPYDSGGEEDARPPMPRNVPVGFYHGQPQHGGYGGPSGHPHDAYLPPQGHLRSGSGPSTGHGKSAYETARAKSPRDLDQDRNFSKVYPQAASHSLDGQGLEHPRGQFRPQARRDRFSTTSQNAPASLRSLATSPQPAADALPSRSSGIVTPVQEAPSTPNEPAKDKNAATATRARWQQRKFFPQVLNPVAAARTLATESPATSVVPVSLTDRVAQAASVHGENASLPGAQSMRVRPPQRDLPQSRVGPSLRGDPAQASPEPSRQTAPRACAEAVASGSGLSDHATFDPPTINPKRSSSVMNMRPPAQIKHEQLERVSTQLPVSAKVDGVGHGKVGKGLDTTTTKPESSDEEVTPPPSPNTLRNKRLAMYRKRPATGGDSGEK